MSYLPSVFRILAVSFFSLAIVSCGGSDGGDGPKETISSEYVAPEFIITGQLKAANGQLALFQRPEIRVTDLFFSTATASVTGLSIVPNATINLIQIDDSGSQVGDILGTTITDDQGNYSIELPEGVVPSTNLVLQAIGSNNAKLNALVISEEINIDPLSHFIFKELTSDMVVLLSELTVRSVANLTDEINQYVEVNSIDLTPYTNIDASVLVFEQDASLDLLLATQKQLVGGDQLTSIPDELSLEWLAGRTFYSVSYGVIDESGDVDVIGVTVQENSYSDDGSTVTIKFLVGFSSDDVVFENLQITNGIIHASDYVTASKIVCGGVTNQFLRVNNYSRERFDGSRHWYVNLEDALEFANQLDGDIMPCADDVSDIFLSRTLIQASSNLAVDGDLSEWESIESVKTIQGSELEKFGIAYNPSTDKIHVMFEIAGDFLEWTDYEGFLELQAGTSCNVALQIDDSTEASEIPLSMGLKYRAIDYVERIEEGEASVYGVYTHSDVNYTEDEDNPVFGNGGIAGFPLIPGDAYDPPTLYDEMSNWGYGYSSAYSEGVYEASFSRALYFLRRHPWGNGQYDLRSVQAIHVGNRSYIDNKLFNPIEGDCYLFGE